MPRIEITVVGSKYGVTTVNNFVKVDLNGEHVGIIRLEFPADQLVFFENIVICRLPALPDKEKYIIRKRKIELKDAITVMFGDKKLMDLLAKEPPHSLHNSPRHDSYRGGQWVILSHSTVPISHFTLVS